VGDLVDRGVVGEGQGLGEAVPVVVELEADDLGLVVGPDEQLLPELAASTSPTPTPVPLTHHRQAQPLSVGQARDRSIL
jgi:hypothetical protein